VTPLAQSTELLGDTALVSVALCRLHGEHNGEIVAKTHRLARCLRAPKTEEGSEGKLDVNALAIVTAATLPPLAASRAITNPNDYPLTLVGRFCWVGLNMEQTFSGYVA